MDMINTLMEITIYSAVIFGMLVVLKRCLGKRMSPGLHYALWFVLVARLMLPVTMDTGFHLFTLPDNAPAISVSAMDVQSQQDENIDAGMPLVPFVPSMQGGGDLSHTPVQPTPTEPETARLSIQQIALLIWVAGMVAVSIWLAVLYAVLLGRIRRHGAKPAKKLVALLEEVKSELGVRGKIKLICLYEYGTPALMFPNTILMPIDALAAMDAGQVKLALRHELTHYKRGDPLMGLLLSVLNAIYWFNPIVWVAFPMMRADMETACDAMVTRRLTKDEKNEYACLILNLFAQPKHRQIVLGMAQSSTRKLAEQRIRGVFMSTSSKPVAKIVSAAMVLMLLVGCFTTACVPVAEKNETMLQAEDTKSGFGVTSLMAFGHPDVQFTYAQELAPSPGNGVRDTNNTVTPKEAALSGCKSLLDSFGPSVFEYEVSVRYVDDGMNRPYYEIYAGGNDAGSCVYMAVVDAEYGSVSRTTWQLAMSHGNENQSGFSWDGLDRALIEAKCLEAARAWLETRHSVGYFSWDSNTEQMVPFSYENYDLKCRVLLNTGGFEDYYMEYLYDVDDTEAPLTLLSRSIIWVNENGEIYDFAQTNSDNAFSLGMVKQVYQAICGDAPPMQFAETQADLAAYVENARKTLAFSQEHPETRAVAYQYRTYDMEKQQYADEQELNRISQSLSDYPAARLPADLDLIYAYRNQMVNVELDKEHAASFTVFNHRFCGIRFLRHSLASVSMQPAELQLSQTQAIQAAAKLLNQLGLTDAYALARAMETPLDMAYGWYVDDAYKQKAWQLLY